MLPICRPMPLCLFAPLIVATWLAITPATVAQAIAEPEPAIPASLANYINIKDDVFGWKLRGSQQMALGKVMDVELTSQVWQGLTWQHTLQVFEPVNLKYPKHMLLFVTGGRNGGQVKERDTQRGLALAMLCGARVAVVHQVPNQPLLGDHVEDDLITETWLKYLETGDDSWPLLFPMVKSAVRAMDAIQEMSAQYWNTQVDGFVITGASKRGWTSWLAPVADKRIVGTAPVVIDVLNFRAQMDHQLATWGNYSEQIRDYSSKGLIVAGEESEREQKLRLMMDPYTYRQQLGLPKLLVNGTNDPYWVVDAMQFYWDDLQGPKYVLQVPNAGHGLDGGAEYALSTVAAFFQHLASNTPLPELSWNHSNEGDRIRMSVSSNVTPIEVRHWSATSEDKDFRDEHWTSRIIENSGDSFSASIPKPASYSANYLELKYEFNQVPYSLCTRIYRD